MNAFERSVLNTVRQYDMIAPGQHVVVGLSGGADSTCLLIVLHALQNELACTLSAVHVHHGLRASADRDAAFCHELCDRLGIPLTVVRADAAAYAVEHGQSVEEAGRSIRYAAFREELERYAGKACNPGPAGQAQDLTPSAGAAAQVQNQTSSTHAPARDPNQTSPARNPDLALPTCGCIATAHHREDLAETVLFHLCRGSGIAGLAGIRPVAGDIVRPLLYVSREEIENHLRQQGIAWCEDETNADMSYTRNYLRITVLPGLAAHVNAGTTDHLVRLAGEAAETEQYLAEQTMAAWERCRRAEGISVAALCREPMLLRRRMLYQMIVRAAGRSKDITAAHVQALLSICESGSGTACVDLPYGLVATRTYDTLSIRSHSAAGETDDAGAAGQTDGAGLMGETDDAGTAGTYRMHVFCRAEGDTSICREEYTKWFDYDRIGAFPTLRTRREGDVITIGGGVVKSLRRFMIDHKIPRQIRDQLEIPFAGNQALWIPGHQMNAAFKVTDETSRILEITYIS